MRFQPFLAGARLPAVSLLALFAAGCSSIGGTYESFDVNDGSGAVLSADKRAIIVWKDVAIQNGDGTWHPQKIVACPEPQPDAMRAVAEQFSGAIKAKAKAEAQDGGGAGAEGEGSAEIAKAASEAVASLGRKTPTVQLLRDALYRTCEGVANGVLGTHDVPFIVSRLDNLMLGLHAIDGLTAMHGSPAVSIGTLIGNPPKDSAPKESTPKDSAPKGGTPKDGTTAQPVSGGDQRAISVRPHDVTINIEPDAANPGAKSSTATVAAEVRKIVAISLFDRSCGLELGEKSYNDCVKEQQTLIELAFRSEEPTGGDDKAPGDRNVKPSPKRRPLALLNRD